MCVSVCARTHLCGGVRSSGKGSKGRGPQLQKEKQQQQQADNERRLLKVLLELFRIQGGAHDHQLEVRALGEDLHAQQ